MKQFPDSWNKKEASGAKSDQSRTYDGRMIEFFVDWFPSKREAMERVVPKPDQLPTAAFRAPFDAVFFLHALPAINGLLCSSSLSVCVYICEG